MTDPTTGDPKGKQGKQIKDLKLNKETVQELTQDQAEGVKGGLRRRGDTDDNCTTSGSSCCSEISTDCC
jgi:hypothetical protein